MEAVKLRRGRRRLGRTLLRWTEVLFLRLSGWKRENADLWHPPVDFPSKNNPARLAGYKHGHAVNAQKFWDHNGG